LGLDADCPEAVKFFMNPSGPKHDHPEIHLILIGYSSKRMRRNNTPLPAQALELPGNGGKSASQCKAWQAAHLAASNVTIDLT